MLIHLLRQDCGVVDEACFCVMDSRVNECWRGSRKKKEKNGVKGMCLKFVMRECVSVLCGCKQTPFAPVTSFFFSLSCFSFSLSYLYANCCVRLLGSEKGNSRPTLISTRPGVAEVTLGVMLSELLAPVGGVYGKWRRVTLGWFWGRLGSAEGRAGVGLGIVVAAESAGVMGGRGGLEGVGEGVGADEDGGRRCRPNCRFRSC